jgi:hypothetical protein
MGMPMRTTLLSRSLALAISASCAFLAPGAAADTIAYAEEAGGGGFQFVRVDFSGNPPQDIGAVSIYFWAGAFVDDDFSKEYVIAYPSADLYSIDVLTAEPTLIGNASTPGNDPTGMHWDRASGQSFLIATDVSCATSTLYRLDVSDASTAEVGSTPGCITSLAIDAGGSAFGVDLIESALVSIDTTTGAATLIGPLGFSPEFAIGGFDFDPATGALYLFAYDAVAGSNGGYVVDTVSGQATLVMPNTGAFAGLAFALAPDPMFANGFDR